jgi:hypothetical protein
MGFLASILKNDFGEAPTGDQQSFSGILDDIFKQATSTSLNKHNGYLGSRHIEGLNREKAVSQGLFQVLCIKKDRHQSKPR